jgi:predicted GNAT family acetyltransferase
MPGNPTITSKIILREAVRADIPRLALLHMITWDATYPDEKYKPSFETRASQWIRSFDTEQNWFCYVLENEKTELIGFAKGKKERDGSGNLNTLYLIEAYKYQGFGRVLIGQVIRRFIHEGIRSMWVVAESDNTIACMFYEKMGGIRKTDTDPGVSVYVWKDITSFV